MRLFYNVQPHFFINLLFCCQEFANKRIRECISGNKKGNPKTAFLLFFLKNYLFFISSLILFSNSSESSGLSFNTSFTASRP